MTENDLRPYRRLWASVLTAVMSDHRAALVAASRRQDFYSHDGKLRKPASYATELHCARGYYESSDARRVASLAGTELRVDRVMEYLTRDLSDPEVRA